MVDGPTRTLAVFALDAGPLAASVIDQAERAFTNHVGCTIGGLREPAAVQATKLADELSGQRTATVFGSALRLDPVHAATINCLQSSIQTFDDTHLATVVHPTGPVASALWALLEHRSGLAIDGMRFLTALAVGIEISCRLARVLTAPPAAPHLGLFMTGITGGVGAAAACARLLGLDLTRAQWAIGIAAAQAGGLRSTHTTMAGGLVPALAARAGLESALLASHGFDGPAQGLEHRNGLIAAFAPGADPQPALQDLGRRFELDDLSFKPYPCGVVIHPTIDGCLELVPLLEGLGIGQVELQVHPLTLQLTGTRHPAHALACNASVFHWAAAALVRGRAGIAEATERALRDPAIAALRGRIVATADERLALDEAIVQVRPASDSGSGPQSHAMRRVHVRHARGSRKRPLTDAELSAKAMNLASPILGERRARGLIGRCKSLRGAAASGLV